MPQQELFFEEVLADRRIEVIKTYDSRFAREAFGNMGDDAQELLWASLKIDDNYEPGDIPPVHGPASADFLWEELLEAAREDGNLLSFFVVNETKDNVSESLYISPDWPSAEAFAKRRSASVQ